MTILAKPFLPYGRQLVEDDDLAAVAAVLKSEYLTTGPVVGEFETAFADRVGARHAVACSSGTAALHLAAMALRLGPGDAVVVPSLTFVATANVVRFVGAEVVFADVDADSGLMTAEHLSEALSRAAKAGIRVKAVFPVHLNGQCVDMEAIADLVRQHDLRTVEDACHALGGAYGPREGAPPVGSCAYAEAAAFSFHPVKAIAMGEGGIVTSNDTDLHSRLLRFRNHGLVCEPSEFEEPGYALDATGAPNPWYYEMPEPGFNYRASDIHCALGLSQLGKLDRFIAVRNALAARYDAALAPLAPAIRPIARTTAGRPAWHLYVVLIEFEAIGRERSDVMTRLRKAGVGSQVHYLPVHLQPYYRKRYGALALPGAERYYARALSLPLFPGMSEEDVDRVASELAKACGR